MGASILGDPLIQAAIGVFGISGTIFGLYSLIMQLRDRNKIDPKIIQVFIRITNRLGFLVQATLSNLGNKVAENCMARIFADENAIGDLSFMPVDSPLGRLGPDWPQNTVFRILSKTQITVRGYLSNTHEEQTVHIRLMHENREKDRSQEFTLIIPEETRRQVTAQDRVPEPIIQLRQMPSYPEQEWEFLWYKYTGGNVNPWGDFVVRTTYAEVNFDENWGEDEVDNTGQFDNIGFIASRTIKVDAGRYIFIIGGDDGIKLTVFNEELSESLCSINGWRNQSYTTYSDTVNLPAGIYKLHLEWYENMGAARAKFEMRLPS